MTLYERSRLATEARQRKVAERRAILLRAVSEGKMVKQAAWLAGVSQRTASRYMAWAR